jgi:hypothetical protein
MNTVGRACSPDRGRMPLPKNGVSGWTLAIIAGVELPYLVKNRSLRLQEPNAKIHHSALDLPILVIF